MILVAVKEPGKDPVHVWSEATYQRMQERVGGKVRTVTLCTDLVIIRNEDGQASELLYNCNICGKDFYGTVIFAGIKDGKLTDIPWGDQTLRKMLPGLWREKA